MLSRWDLAPHRAANRMLRNFSPGARTNIFCARWLPAGGSIVAARMQTRDAQVTTSSKFAVGLLLEYAVQLGKEQGWRRSWCSYWLVRHYFSAEWCSWRCSRCDGGSAAD